MINLSKDEIIYPLMENCPEKIRPASGKPLDELTLENVLAGKLQLDDCRISAETLRMQAQVARDEGYIQVSESLCRAAEMVAVPDDIILQTYNMMRPFRADEEELLAIADRYEQEYQAPITANFIRESASILKSRAMLKKDRRIGG